MLVYETEVTAAAPLLAGSQITNTATLSGTGLTAPLTAQATVSVETGAEPSVVKSLSPATVAPNGQLTYSFTIQNSGNEAAGADANVTISDLFDPVLKNLSVSLDGQPLALTTDYSYSEANGQFDTVPGRITVPAATYTQNPATGVYTAETEEGTRYAFAARPYGYSNELMEFYYVLDENGAITALRVAELILHDDYFSDYELDESAYKEGFLGLTAGSYTGEQALITGATMSSDAADTATRDVFEAFGLLTGNRG